MARLNQIIAVVKGEKQRVYEAITKLHQAVQKGDLLRGQTRVYRPKDDDGETLPGERSAVQVKAERVLDDAAGLWARLWDLLATADEGNTRATADVVVDGQVLLAMVPATTLLAMEKQLADVRTFFAKLPVLDPAHEWTYDPNVNAYTTKPVDTTRTKKVPRVLTKAEATDRHPAQVEVWHEDITVGYWSTMHQSGALPQARVTQLVGRIDTLLVAVKAAREAANMVEVRDQHIGKPIMDYLLAK